MTNQSTIDKLIEMRLTTMADAFRSQLNDPKFKEVSFEDRFGMLVDIEYSNRKITTRSASSAMPDLTSRKQTSWISTILPDAS